MNIITKKTIAIFFSTVCFISNSFAGTADYAPVGGSIIFFSVSTIIAIKSMKKKAVAPKTASIADAPATTNQETQPLFDPQPILKSALSY